MTETKTVTKQEDHAIGRMMEKVKKDEGCWMYQGFGMGNYGGVWGVDKQQYAHRFAYEAFIGPIPDGLLVMHKCDRPRCVNPAHLKVGTQSENLKDMVRKGRRTEWPTSGSWGPDNPPPQPTRKLSDDEVREIRSRYEEEDITQVELAAEYGIDDSHVSRLVRRIARPDVI